jgi:tetratricopeptide (TPR) repeat protein
MSKLSSYCVGLMEAVWLAAVVLVPTVMNPHSERGFELNKLLLLRGLALIALAAGLVRSVEGWLDRGESRPTPGVSAGGGLLAIPLLALGLAYLLSTFFSIYPSASLLGGDNLQNTCTFFSYMVIFAAAAAGLRRPDQIERLVTAVILPSLPVALYAMIQRAGRDPFAFGHALGDRPFSTLGNPNYLGAYLVMVMPVTAWRILRSAQGLSQASERRDLHRVVLGLYSLVGLAQCAALTISQGRGAVLGAFAGGLTFSLLLGAYWCRRRLLAVPLVLGGLSVVFLLVLNLPDGPLRSLRRLPVFERFAQISGKEGSNARAELWAAAPALIRSPEPVSDGKGGKDAYHALRPFLGYGPETLPGVLPTRFSMPSANPTLEDRFHNLVWDQWYSIGAIGLAAFLTLFSAAFFVGYRRLGLIVCRRDAILFWGLSVALSAGGAIGLSAWRGMGFAGLGLQLGLAAGLGFFPLLSGLFLAHGPAPAGANAANATLLIALLAALTGHLVETAFAFAISASATLFWVYLGAIVALMQPAVWDLPGVAVPGAATGTAPVGSGRMRDAKRRPQPLSYAADASRWGQRQPALMAAAVTATLLVALLFNFISMYSRSSGSALDFLSRALTQTDGLAGTNRIIILLLLATWGATCLAMTFSELTPPNLRRWGSQFLTALTLSGATSCLYAVAKAAQLAAIGPFPTASVSTEEVLAQSAGYERVYLTFLGVLAGLVLVWALICAWRTLPGARALAKAPWAVGFILAALVANHLLNVVVGLGGARARWAVALHSQKLYPAAAAVYEQAVEREPGSFALRSRLSGVLQDQAKATFNESRCNELLGRSEQILIEAEQRFPFTRAANHLGDLYRTWALREPHPERKLELALKASRAFDRALLSEPTNPQFWCQSAQVDLILLDREQEGLRKARQALSLYAQTDQAYSIMGKYYARKGAAAADSATKKRYDMQAVGIYREAVTNLADSGTALYPFQVASGNLLLDVDDAQSALPGFLEAAKTAPPDVMWQVNEGLARAYLRLTNKSAALQSIQQAIQAAPASEKAALQQLQGKIQKP